MKFFGLWYGFLGSSSNLNLQVVWLIMTIPDSSFIMDNGESCLPHPPEEENRIVMDLMNKSESNLKEGNIYYVISNRYFLVFCPSILKSVFVLSYIPIWNFYFAINILMFVWRNYEHVVLGLSLSRAVMIIAICHFCLLFLMSLGLDQEKMGILCFSRRLTNLSLVLVLCKMLYWTEVNWIWSFC